MDRRRQTLAGLSPSQVNVRAARASLAPGRVMKPAAQVAKLEQALGRLSLAGGPVQRRSSTYTKASGVKQDPRPVSDKQYQQNCIRVIITYLAGHGYEHAITPKVLASPTTKDFANIMGFLFRQVDPNLNTKNMGKIEEEVPQLFKRLKYPFQISKSNLSAGLAPHYDARVVNCATMVQCSQEVLDERQKAEVDFFDWVSSSYRYFMAGDDEKCEEVEAEKAKEFDDRSGGIVKDTERLREANDALRAEIEQLRNEPSPLVAARAGKETCLADKEKFVKLIDNLQAHRQSLQRKIQERQADVNAHQQELASIDKENEVLRGKISVQTVNREDVIRMNQEKSKQEAVLRSVLGQREALDRRVVEQEGAIQARLDSVDAALQGYHSMADRLQLIPASAKRAEGVNFDVRLDRLASSAGEMINVDLKGIIKPALQRLRDSYNGRARELADEMLSLQERRDTGIESMSERTEENAQIEAQVRKLDAQLRTVKDAFEAQAASTAAHLENLQAEVSQLRNANSDSVVDSEERLQQLQGDFEDLQRACELENATLHRDLAAALELVLNHKLQVQARLKAAHGRVGGLLQEVQRAGLPAMAAS
ncbi:hypothetical protein N2152v2_002949 [Parachlorella kessleri]